MSYIGKPNARNHPPILQDPWNEIWYSYDWDGSADADSGNESKIVAGDYYADSQGSPAQRWVPQVPTGFNTKNGLLTWIYLDGLGVTAIFRKPSFVDWFTMATIVLLGFKSPFWALMFKGCLRGNSCGGSGQLPLPNPNKAISPGQNITQPLGIWSIMATIR